jgi:hypothetical protein
MHRWTTIILGGLLFTLAGCGEVPTPSSPGVPAACQQAAELTPTCWEALYTRYQPLLRAAVQTATGIYLAQHPDRGPAVYAVLQPLHTALDQHELSTPAQLEILVRQRIAWDTLPPATRLGVEALLTAVRVALEALLQDLGVRQPPHVRLVARDVVHWATVAVLVQCAPCRAAIGPRG